MNALTQIRTRLHEQLLRKQLPAQPVHRRSVFLNQAQSVGIMFDGTAPEDRDVVMQYAKKMKEEGKKVKLMCFFNNRLKSDNFTFAHFNRKQLDWALRPKTPEVQAFLEQSFDLMLNFSPHASIPLDYIAALSKAGFRVGPCTEKTFCYDLMIEHDPGKGLKAFIGQMFFYLQDPAKKVKKEKRTLQGVG